VIKTRLISKSKFLFQVLCLLATIGALAWEPLEAVLGPAAHGALWAAVVTGYVSMARVLWTAHDLWRRDDVPLEMR
jgi:hypothetical protein